MKAVSAKDLIVGRVYSDTHRVDDGSTFLRYRGATQSGDPIFIYVGGIDTYIPEHEDGSFSLSSSILYAELSKKQLKQYLPK